VKVGDITEFGEVSFIDYELCFVQFCDVGSAGIYGVYSMTYEEIEGQVEREKEGAK
jgi:hypothetical protein